MQVNYRIDHIGNYKVVDSIWQDIYPAKVIWYNIRQRLTMINRMYCRK